jgi:hypothetical protein
MRDTYDHRPGNVFVRPVVCLIPLGTANALAGSAGITLGSWKQLSSSDESGSGETTQESGEEGSALKVMLTGKPTPLPMFEVKFSPGSRLVTNEGQERKVISESDEPTIYGAVIFSWCLHASLVALSDTTEYRKHGVERFKMAAGELMKDEHLWKGKVSFKRERDGEYEELSYGAEAGGHIYIVAPLVSQLDPGFVISPHTKTPDDTLRLLAISPAPGSSSSEMNSGAEAADARSTYTSHIYSILMAAYNKGAHITPNQSPHVQYHPITSLRIEMQESDEKRRMVCVDGTIVAVEEGGWVEMTMLEGKGMGGRRVVDVVV